MANLSHIDEAGKAKMVDIGKKPSQIRVAKAAGKIILQQATIKLIQENQIKKGDVLTVAKIAGIHAAKKNYELIPLCHPLMLENIELTLELMSDGVEVVSNVKTTGKTGVEMEALTAVSVALLTIYDMCKKVDKKMCITDIKLLSKEKF